MHTYPRLRGLIFSSVQSVNLNRIMHAVWRSPHERIQTVWLRPVPIGSCENHTEAFCQALAEWIEPHHRRIGPRLKRSSWIIVILLPADMCSFRRGFVQSDLFWIWSTFLSSSNRHSQPQPTLWWHFCRWQTRSHWDFEFRKVMYCEF